MSPRELIDWTLQASGWGTLANLEEHKFIDCQPPALKKGQPWYATPNALMRFRLWAGEPMDLRKLIDEADPPGVSARRLNAALLRHFESEMARSRA